VHFYTHKAYKSLTGSAHVHPVFRWLWKTSCQNKRKFFFWLVLKDRLSTRELLRRKHIVGVRSHGGPKPTSECCVSLTRMVMQGEYTGIYPGSGKEGPTSSGGREFVFPCTEVLA
jgi:hypothetical protein